MKRIFQSNITLGILFIIFAVLFSEILVHLQLITYWDEEHHRTGYYLGFWTSLIVASIVVHLLLYIKYIHEKELKKQSLIHKKQSITDVLTTLYNRRYFNKLFPSIINSAKRNNELVTLIIIDIDYFKQYNDTLGHLKGDEALISVSKCIKNSLHRADDLCFRLGGEEFAVLLKVDTKEKALEYTKVIKTNIDKLEIEHPSSEINKHLTVSIGLCCKNAINISSDIDFFKETDDLLYKAKANGRNTIEQN